MNIGVFGGSFNPPHIGHQMVCVWALTTKKIDELWLVPCQESRGNDKVLAPYINRLAMCNIMANVLYGFPIRVKEDQEDGKTYLLLKRFESEYPNYKFMFIGGPDLDISTWYEYKKFEDEFLIEKFPFKIDIRSTLIREEVKENNYRYVDNAVSIKISNYIIGNSLYKEK